MARERIAVLTSGGDAPGMNAAIATIVRAASKKDLEVLGVRRGYEGLYLGDMISLDVHSVSGVLRRSGTILGSARYPEITDNEAAFNTWAGKVFDVLSAKGIRALIVLGGDGSFQGATRLFRYLRDTHGITIPIVGIPCSIDNDISGTDYSIGADTALNTTMKLMDSLVGTAYSHGRTFLVETMGAKAGYLALMAALTGEAEAVYIPEDSGITLDWRSRLRQALRDHFSPYLVDLRDPPFLQPQKSQATVVFAEGFNWKQRKLLTPPAEGERDEWQEWRKELSDQLDQLTKCVRQIHDNPETSERVRKRAATDLAELQRMDGLVAEPALTQNLLTLWERYDSCPVLEIRSSVPGHVVRGEAPTARDRILACLLGMRAVHYVSQSWEAGAPVQRYFDKKNDGQDGLMVGIRGNRVRAVGLRGVVTLSEERGGELNPSHEYSFREVRTLVETLGRVAPTQRAGPENRTRFAILTAGADAPGMNAAVRAITRAAINDGIEPWGIRNSFTGLYRAGETKEGLPPQDLKVMALPEAATAMRDVIREEYLRHFNLPDEGAWTLEIMEVMRRIGDLQRVGYSIRDVVPWALREAAYLFRLDWMRVNNIAKLPGSILGSVRTERSFTVEEWNRMADKLKAWRIGGLVVIGGLREMARALEFSKYVEIPVIAVPATIDNDIPRTHASIGADTALNTICESVDRVMATAAANYRVFVIEVMGRVCGYLAFMGALAGGAEAVLIPERPFTLENLREVSEHLREACRTRRRHGVIICEEKACAEMNPVEVCNAIGTMGRPFFETRFVRLGHIQRGGVPSAFDRELGSRMGSEAIRAFQEGEGKPPVVIVLQPIGEERDFDDEIDNEGWKLARRKLHEVVTQPDPPERIEGGLETNFDWWQDDWKDLQMVMMGPPFYDLAEGRQYPSQPPPAI